MTKQRSSKTQDENKNSASSNSDQDSNEGALTPADALKEAIKESAGNKDSISVEQVVEKITHFESESFFGPIAHPAHLRAYEEVLPGAAERIISMAESTHSHNIQISEKMASAEISDRERGMNFALGRIPFNLHRIRRRQSSWRIRGG